MMHPFRFFLICFALAPLLYGQGLSPEEQQIRETAQSISADALKFLEKVVNINSGTLNLKGVRKVGKAYARKFKGIGFDTRWVDMPPEMLRAGHLIATRSGNRGKKLLLVGHLDTVFEKRSPFQKFTRQGDTAFGPGVNDMHGGNVIFLYALITLHRLGHLDGATIAAVLHGDEEKVGRPHEISRRDIREIARNSDAALAYEAQISGTGTIARRGSSNWFLEVTGRRAHSSGIFSKESGAGAIFEASRILNAFYDEVRGEEFLSFNPGSIVGGTDVAYNANTTSGEAFGKTNVIAQKVVVDGGLRFITEEQKENARDKMREIVSRSLPVTSATITFEDRYPAMPPRPENYALLEVFSRVSLDLGYGVRKPFDPGKRGAGDIAFVAELVPALDGLGVVGSGGHTPQESVNIPEIAKAIEMSALLIYRLTR